MALLFRLEGMKKPLQPSLRRYVNQGIYQAQLAYDALCWATSWQHPAPEEDAALAGIWCKMAKADRAHYVFGFKNLKQLCAWFDDDAGKRTLAKQKVARIGVYDIPDHLLIEGDNQCIALACELTLIDTIAAYRKRYVNRM